MKCRPLRRLRITWLALAFLGSCLYPALLPAMDAEGHQGNVSDVAGKPLRAIEIRAPHTTLQPPLPGELTTPVACGVGVPRVYDTGHADWATTVSWATPGVVHRPLFFEDLALERHGVTRSARLQPAISALRFGWDAVLMPWRLAHGDRRLERDVLPRHSAMVR